MAKNSCLGRPRRVVPKKGGATRNVETHIPIQRDARELRRQYQLSVEHRVPVVGTDASRVYHEFSGKATRPEHYLMKRLVKLRAEMRRNFPDGKQPATSDPTRYTLWCAIRHDLSLTRQALRLRPTMLVRLGLPEKKIVFPPRRIGDAGLLAYPQTQALDFNTDRLSLQDRKLLLQRVRQELTAMRQNSRAARTIQPKRNGPSPYARFGFSADPRVDFTHMESGWILGLSHRLAQNRVRSTKAPRLLTRYYYGIELEMNSAFDRNILPCAFIKAGLKDHVHVGTDNSVNTNANSPAVHPQEVRVLVAEDELDSVIDRVCGVLAEGLSDVNGSCGMHVHLDFRNRDPIWGFKRLVAAQDFLYACVAMMRRENDRYCARTKETIFSEAVRAGARYRAINATAYTKYRTIEIRLHQGTVQARKVKEWCRLLTAIINAKEIAQPEMTLEDLADIWDLSREQVEYWDTRIRQLYHGRAPLPFVPVSAATLTDIEMELGETTQGCSCAGCFSLRNRPTDPWGVPVLQRQSTPPEPSVWQAAPRRPRVWQTFTRDVRDAGVGFEPTPVFDPLAFVPVMPEASRPPADIDDNEDDRDDDD